MPKRQKKLGGKLKHMTAIHNANYSIVGYVQGDKILDTNYSIVGYFRQDAILGYACAPTRLL